MSSVRGLVTAPPHSRSIVRLGAYDILGLLGEGGMGSVYAARHRLTGELRALKVLKPELGIDREFVERFLREVRVAASLRHDNLVRVMDPGIDGDIVFLPMELLQGETLASLLARAGTLEAHDAATIVLCLARGVSAIHAAGVLHRDIKPLNVFLASGAGGAVTPKLLDFGMARELGDTEHTRSGIVAGSPFYMAPEQAAGSKDLDARVDQYALAVVAYQMLTGRRPYESDDGRSVLAKLLRREPYPGVRELARRIPEACALAIERALSPDAPQRFPSVASFALALAQPIAARLGSRSAVAALAGGSDAVLDTTPDERAIAYEIDPARAEAAARMLESLEPSCVLSVPPAAPQPALNVPAPTMVLEDLHSAVVANASSVQAIAGGPSRAAAPIAAQSTALLDVRRAEHRRPAERTKRLALVACTTLLSLLVATAILAGAFAIARRGASGEGSSSDVPAGSLEAPFERDPLAPIEPRAADSAPAELADETSAVAEPASRQASRTVEPSANDAPETVSSSPTSSREAGARAAPVTEHVNRRASDRAGRGATALAESSSDEGTRAARGAADARARHSGSRPERVDREPAERPQVRPPTCVPANGIPCIE